MKNKQKGFKSKRDQKQTVNITKDNLQGKGVFNGATLTLKTTP